MYVFLKCLYVYASADGYSAEFLEPYGDFAWNETGMQYVPQDNVFIFLTLCMALQPF